MVDEYMTYTVPPLPPLLEAGGKAPSPLLHIHVHTEEEDIATLLWPGGLG